LVTALTWLLSQSRASQGVKLTLLGLELDHPSSMVGVAPLAAAYLTYVACVMISNVVWLSVAHDTIFAVAHRSGYDQELEKLFWPGDSPISGEFGQVLLDVPLVSSLTQVFARGRTYGLLLAMAASNAYVNYAAIQKSSHWLTDLAVAVAALVEVYAVSTVTVYMHADL